MEKEEIVEKLIEDTDKKYKEAMSITRIIEKLKAKNDPMYILKITKKDTYIENWYEDGSFWETVTDRSNGQTTDRYEVGRSEVYRNLEGKPKVEFELC